MEVSKEDEMKNRKYIRLLAWISSVLMLFGMVYNVFVPMLYKIIMFSVAYHFRFAVLQAIK
jgi:hypothetical protein